MSIAPPSHARRENTTTPKWLIDKLGPFDLDPCQSTPQPWPCAARAYTEGDNGLMRDWEGFVWCNPPYGKRAAGWLDKMALHNNGIALVFARTETRMFFRSVWHHATSLLFLRGRLTFHYPDGSTPRNGANSGGPSVLIAYGQEAHERLKANLGALCKLTNQ